MTNEHLMNEGTRTDWGSGKTDKASAKPDDRSHVGTAS